MRTKKMIFSLLGLCLIGFLLSRILCQYNEVWGTYEVTAYLALGVFSVFTLIQYFSAQRMLSFKNKGAFIGLVMGATFIKMILSFVVLGVYAKINALIIFVNL